MSGSGPNIVSAYTNREFLVFGTLLIYEMFIFVHAKVKKIRAFLEHPILQQK